MTQPPPPPDRSGVYRAPAAVAGAQGYDPARAAWIEANLAGVQDKLRLMDVLARSFSFPAGFGGNWDALADSLQDLSWRPARGHVIHLRNAAEAKHALGPDWLTFVEILRLSSIYWKARRKTFVVLVEGDEELPAWT